VNNDEYIQRQIIKIKTVQDRAICTMADQ